MMLEAAAENQRTVPEAASESKKSAAKLGVSNRTQAALAAIAMDAGTPPGLASTGIGAHGVSAMPRPGLRHFGGRINTQQAVGTSELLRGFLRQAARLNPLPDGSSTADSRLHAPRPSERGLY